MGKNFLNVNLKASELALIGLKIALIEFAIEGMIMFCIFPLIDGKLSPFWENMLDPLVLVFFTFPLISYWVIAPYVRQRDANEEELKTLKKEAEIAHKFKEDVFSRNAEMLKEAVDKATQKLQYSEARYALASQATQDGLWDWNVNQNTTYFSNRWKEILGYGEDDFPNEIQFWFDQIHPDDQARIVDTVLGSKEADIHSKFTCEYQMLHRDGHYIWVQTRWVVTREENTNELRLVGAQSDITERKRMESKFIHDALHDDLTGLPNRTLLTDRLKQRLLEFQRKPSKRFCLLFIDVDNFKRINDTMGHSAGDILLRKISERLTHVLRKVDTVSRLGGDEFAVLLPDFESQDDLANLLDRLIIDISKPLEISQKTLTPQVSIGVVISEKYHQRATPEALLIDADLALYKTKETKKGTYTLFTPQLRDKVSEQFEIGNCLKNALNLDEIALFYQPIVNIKTDQVAGFEALMRWKHPRYGWIPPTCFIPIAEESDMINALGKYALDKSLEQLRKWNVLFGREDWFMSVNVSGRQLEDNNFLTIVKDALKSNLIDGGQLQIEITESVLFENSDKIFWYLSEIKKMGAKLAIDDFGVGYSSLGSFSQYPFDTIKVDKSFVDMITSNSRSKLMINLVQTLAQSLEMKTVAEGVETKTQVEALRKLGYENIQGYYFSKPQSDQDITQLLNNGLQPSQWNQEVSDEVVVKLDALAKKSREGL